MPIPQIELTPDRTRDLDRSARARVSKTKRSKARIEDGTLRILASTITDKVRAGEAFKDDEFSAACDQDPRLVKLRLASPPPRKDKLSKPEVKPNKANGEAILEIETDKNYSFSKLHGFKLGKEINSQCPDSDEDQNRKDFLRGLALGISPKITADFNQPSCNGYRATRVKPEMTMLEEEAKPLKKKLPTNKMLLKLLVKRLNRYLAGEQGHIKELTGLKKAKMARRVVKAVKHYWQGFAKAFSSKKGK